MSIFHYNSYMKYKLSVVIPAHNRSNNIKELVTKFLEINDVEIIVIENGSNKKEKVLYKTIEKEYKNQKNVKFFFNTWGSSSKARKEGANKSTGSHIFFCDDDDFPTDEFVNWVNKNTLNDEIYSFNLWTSRDKKLVFKSPKSFKDKEIKKILQPSVWITTNKILKEIHKDKEYPLDITMGEDQILGLYIFRFAQSKDLKLNNTNIKSIMYGYSSGTTICKNNRNLENDLKINIWLKTIKKDNLVILMNNKMLKHRLSENKRGVYSTNSKLNKDLINKYKTI